MVSKLTNQEFDSIRRQLEEYCGILLDDDQGYLVEYRLTDLADERGFESFGQLSRKMAYDEVLLSKVVDLMTIKETHWFRDESLWKTMRDIVIPTAIERIENQGTDIRIWSAACSTGQEPYSLVILIHETLEKMGMPHLLSKFQIICTDISEDALDMAREGCYDNFSIQRGMPADLVNRFFIKRENRYCLSEKIKNSALFFRLNLKDPIHQLGKFDVILCRNVAIYFSNQSKKKLFEKMRRMLREESVLFLGATESLFGISEEFESFSHGNGLYFKVKP